MDRPRAPRLAFLALPLLLLPAGASAQSAADVLDDVREAYERRTEGIENYTVVERVMGQEVTVHFVRTEIDGIVVFQPQDMSDMPEGAPGGTLDPAFLFRPEVGARMTYEGREEVGGEACHELGLDDFEGLALERIMPGNGGFEPESLGLCVDDDEHVLRRMVMRATTQAAGEPQEVTVTAVLSDYRSVEGMLHPFRVEMTTEGLQNMAQSPEMSEAMARMREQLEQLPEAQREQMRRMMESRMGGMEDAMGMAAGEPVVIETLEVRVNEGPPSGG